jgi:hypothetical protein
MQGAGIRWRLVASDARIRSCSDWMVRGGGKANEPKRCVDITRKSHIGDRSAALPTSVEVDPPAVAGPPPNATVDMNQVQGWAPKRRTTGEDS